MSRMGQIRLHMAALVYEVARRQSVKLSFHAKGVWRALKGI